MVCGTQGYGGESGVDGEGGQAFGGAACPCATFGGALPGVAILFGNAEFLSGGG